MDIRLNSEELLRLLAEKKDEPLRFAGDAWEKLQAKDYSVLKPAAAFVQKTGQRLKTAKKIRAGAAKVRAAREKIPTREDVKTAFLGIWAKVLALFAAVCANFRHPGLSEFAAIGAFVISIGGSVAAIFHKKLRRLMPLFGTLAAIGTAIVILRAIFPRRED